MNQNGITDITDITEISQISQRYHRHHRDITDSAFLEGDLKVAELYTALGYESLRLLKTC